MQQPKAMTASQVEAQLSNIPGWEAREGKLYRRFKFDSFSEAFGWMAAAALSAEAMNHHPDWSNVYSTVVVYLNTHDAQGITDLDFKLAARMSELYERYAS